MLLRLPKVPRSIEDPAVLSYLDELVRALVRQDFEVFRREEWDRGLGLRDGIGNVLFVVPGRKVPVTTAVTGASLTLTGLVPAGLWLVGVFTKNLTAIVGPALAYTVGHTGLLDAWGTMGLAQAAEVDTVTFQERNISLQPVPLDVILTPDAPFTSGTVEVTAWCLDLHFRRGRPPERVL